MSEKYKSVKIDKNKYRVPIPKRRFSINVSDKFCIVNHKNRWVVALTQDEGWKSVFFSNQTLNRTQALQLISFLSDYINLVKPTNETALHASIKVSTNRIMKNTNKLLGIALKEKHD